MDLLIALLDPPPPRAEGPGSRGQPSLGAGRWKGSANHLHVHEDDGYVKQYPPLSPAVRSSTPQQRHNMEKVRPLPRAHSEPASPRTPPPQQSPARRGSARVSAAMLGGESPKAILKARDSFTSRRKSVEWRDETQGTSLKDTRFFLTPGSDPLTIDGRCAEELRQVSPEFQRSGVVRVMF